MGSTRIVRDQGIWLLAIVSVCSGLFTPSPAAAHLVTTGMGTVYDGIGHLLLTPEDILPAFAVALYAGLRGKEMSRLTLTLFPVAWIVGGGIGMTVDTISTPPIQILSLSILGGLVAVDAKLSKPAILILFSVVGAVHGFFNGVALAGGPGMSGILGIGAILFVLIAITAAMVTTIRIAWMRVAVRVVGSWIAAIGMLMIGWAAAGVG